MLNIWECLLHEIIKDFKHLMLSDVVKNYINEINMQNLDWEIEKKATLT